MYLNMVNQYRCLKNSIVEQGRFSIVPIRYEDRISIMNWRNEQIYHLRQNRTLTIGDQDDYFVNVVSKLFDLEEPDQILFSFLEDGKCIGYGGLVHINWIDRNAEISFIMDTKLESHAFEKYWSEYLNLIEAVGFKDLELHKIYTYAFDLRPHLYEVLYSSGYKLDAKLNQHCFFNGNYIDVLIHYKLRG